MTKLLLEIKCNKLTKDKLCRGSMLKSKWPMRNTWRTQEVNELDGHGPRVDKTITNTNN